MTHTVSIVLNIDAAQAEEFERAFGEHEVPIWKDLHERGTLIRASLSPLDISTKTVKGVKQYLVLAQFHDPSGHHEHDGDPRFERWNEMADRFQPEEPFVFGGDSFYEVGG
jgi:hypothetical protein